TIEGIIYVTMKNDISFLIDSQLNLYEQQSSYNPNMPLRGLMYFAELYQKHLTELPLETVLHLQEEISVGVCADR
ncbi:MAG: hypothetical protein MSA96_02070, partial [Treponema porcinum]|nr:hypothetical protein [Treponema porcinum]